MEAPMFDLDPRDYDSRDDERVDRDRGSRSDSHYHDRDDKATRHSLPRS